MALMDKILIGAARTFVLCVSNINNSIRAGRDGVYPLITTVISGKAQLESTALTSRLLEQTHSLSDRKLYFSQTLLFTVLGFFVSFCRFFEHGRFFTTTFDSKLMAGYPNTENNKLITKGNRFDNVRCNAE